MSARVRLWSWLLGAAALTLPFTVQPFRYGDEWWHIALGRLILEQGIPTTEPFSFIATQHQWVEQQWLYEVVLAKAYALGGAPLVSLLMGLVATAALLLAALAIPRSAAVGGSWRAAAIIVGGVVASPVLGVRGEVVSGLGVAVILVVLSHWRAGSRRALWALPPIFLLWANLHAGFIAGLAILVTVLLLSARPGSIPAPAAAIVAGIAAFTVIGAGIVIGLLVVVVGCSLVGNREPAAGSRRDLGIAIGVSLLVTLANPAGPKIFGYISATLGNPLLSGAVSEWASPNFHDPFNRILAGTGAVLAALWIVPPRRRLTDAVLAGVAFLAALQAVRNVAIFALVAIPQLAELGAASWQVHGGVLRGRLRAPTFGPALSVAAGLAVAATVVTSLPPRLTADTAATFEATHEPARAATYVGAHFPGQRLLSDDSDGGYLAYRFPHERVVFIYDEIGVFGVDPLTDLLEITRLETDDWVQRIESHGLHHAILPSESALTSALRELGWTIDCYDRGSSRVVMSAGRQAPITSPTPPATSSPC